MLFCAQASPSSTFDWHQLCESASHEKSSSNFRKCGPLVEPHLHSNRAEPFSVHVGLDHVCSQFTLIPFDILQYRILWVNLCRCVICNLCCILCMNLPWNQDWCRILAELSLTLQAFRLFLAAGLLKMRRGSACWKTLTCLYDHYETQPMPNFASWMFHNYTPHTMLSIMQWFAIDLCECIVPFFLLSFVLSMGPLGIVHRRLLERKEWFLRVPATVPGRLLASVFIMIFVFGMFIGGNYAFLHPLACVSLVASMTTVRGTAVIRKREPQAVAMYRTLMPWLVLPLLLFAFLPSLRAYAAWQGLLYLGGF